MTQKHTPGVWTAQRCGDAAPNRWNVIALLETPQGEPQRIRTISQVLDYAGAEEAEANARLIAAAPCMLTAIDRYLAARKALDAAPTHNGPAFEAAMAEHDAALAELSRVATLARGETA